MKQRRIRKLVKKFINAIDNEGAQDVVNRVAEINAMNASQLKTALLNVDEDAEPNKSDAFPNDARETAATADGIGQNKAIHDAALLISAEHTDGATLFASIQTQAGNGAGQVDAKLTAAEDAAVPANHAEDGGTYQTAYDDAKEALDDLNKDIEAFEQHAATVNTLFDSIKDFTATAEVKYLTDPTDATTDKLVTESATEARRHQADFTNNTPELVAANDDDFENLALMDIATEKAKVTTAETGFAARLAALTDPADIPDVAPPPPQGE